MENELFVGASLGDIHLLMAIHEKDKLVLAKFVAGCFNWSPLLVAASQGHEEFVDKLLTLNPELAQASDSQNRSALHVAATKGHVEVVKVLLNKLGPNICYSRDRDGQAPLHVAATNGKVQVVEELLQANAYVARARVDQDETILHLCVKHHQFLVLKVLLAKVKDKDFVNAKDNHGNTLLHVAVYMKQVEVIEYVLHYSKINVNIKNSKGQTALDILYVLTVTTDDAERRELDSIRVFLLRARGKEGNKDNTFFNLFEMKDTILLVASLIAGTSFQTAVNPPGGFWQDNSNGHRAGEAILATTSPKLYSYIMSTNTYTYLISMLMMCCIIAIPFQKRFLTPILVLYNIGLISLMTYAYAMVVYVLAPRKNIFGIKNFWKIAMALPATNKVVGHIVGVWVMIFLATIGLLWSLQIIVHKLGKCNQNVPSRV